jgi:threonine dehydratase
MVERGDRRPLIAASAGNHAAGMAWAAREAGLSATAVVPFGTPRVKIQNCLALGCKVIRRGSCFDESLIEAKQIAVKEGFRFLHPFDDAEIICGQGTIGLELLPHNPDVVLIPVGGGGLAAGVGLAFSQSSTKVIGVQLKGVDSMNRRLKGLPERDIVKNLIADGIAVRNPGVLSTELCRRYLDDIVLVSNKEMLDTMVSLARNHNIIVEGAGALAAAALPYFSGNVVAVLTGGNIDLEVFAQILNKRNMRMVA